MNLLDQYAALQRQGVAILEEIASARRKTDELAATLGVSKSTAGAYQRLAKTMLGAKDRRAVELTQKHAITLDALLAIEKAVRKCDKIDRDEMRVELVEMSAGLTVDEVRDAVDARVRKINNKDGKLHRRAGRRRYVRGGVHTDAAGLRHATWCLPERQMAAVNARLDAEVKRLRAEDPGLTYEQAKCDALYNAVVAGKGGAPADGLVTCVVLRLDELDGAEDSKMLAMTNGARISVAEYAEAKLAPYGLCLVYKDGEPVDLFRTRRFANVKQRQMLAVDQLGCAWPGCSRPASACQPHHITAWRLGGNTNIKEMALLCPKHNGMNDDDPARPRNGRIVKDSTTGRIGWQPPDPGEPPQFGEPPGSGRALGRG